jgi:hypothetical protein
VFKSQWLEKAKNNEARLPARILRALLLTPFLSATGA